MRAHRYLFPVDGLLLLFVFTAAISSLTAYVFSWRWLGLALGLAIYLLLAHGLRHMSAIDIVGRGLMRAAGVYAGLFVGQYGYQGYGETPAWLQRLGATTTFLPDWQLFMGHPNAAATFLALVLPLGVALAWNQRAWRRVGWLALTLICFYALGLTFSRGALLAVAAAVPISLMALARRAWRWTGLVLLIPGLVIFAATVPGSDWAASRLDVYQNSLVVASDYLFTGIGFDTFAMIYARYGLLIQVPFLTYPHNLLLSIWMTHGLAGLITFGLLLVILVQRVRKLRRQPVSPMVHAAWLGLLITLLHGMFDSRQYVETLWLMPVSFGLIGLIGAAVRLRQVEVRLRRWWLLVGLALTLILQQPLRAAWQTNMGALAETRGELGLEITEAERDQLFASALAAYAQALQIDPDWADANRRRGNLYVSMGLYEEAIPLLERALDRNPHRLATIKGLGLAYTWAGQTDMAVAILQRLDSRAVVAQELYNWAVWWWHYAQQPHRARYAFAVGQALAPQLPQVEYWVAQADGYRREGDMEGARIWYEFVLGLQPDNAAAQVGLRQIPDQVSDEMNQK